MNDQGKKNITRKLIALLLLTGFLAYACYLFSWIYSYEGVFDTDEADHANAALELYTALKTLSPGEIWQAITRQAFYPPVHSVAVSLSYLLFSPTIFSSRLPSLIFFIGALLIFSKFLQSFLKTQPDIKQNISFVALLFGAYLLFFSPANAFLAVLSMLEMPGVFLFSVLLWQFYRFETKQPRALLWISLSVILLSLSKYSFAAVSIPVVAVLMLASVIQKRISLKQFLFWSGTIGAVLGLWLLIVDRDSIYQFIFNQPPAKGGIWTYQNLIYYPRVLVKGHLSSWALAFLTVLTAIYGAYRYRKHITVQFAALSFCFGLITFTLCSQNGSRHLAFLDPALWFLSAIGLAHALSILKQKNSRTLAVSALFVLCVFSTIFRLNVMPEKFAGHFESPPGSVDIFEIIHQHTTAESKILIEGDTDAISLEGLRWYIAARRKQPYTAVTVDSYPFSKGDKERALAHKRNIALPFGNPAVPRKPLSKILATKEYDYYIQLKTRYFDALQYRRRIKHKTEHNTNREYIKQFPAQSHKSISTGLDVFIYKLS